MINLIFSQIYSPKLKPATEIKVNSSVITVDGSPYDLKEVPDGATVTQHPIFELVERKGSDFFVKVKVYFSGGLPSNYGKLQDISIKNNGSWELSYIHTRILEDKNELVK